MYCAECGINYSNDYKYCVTCNEELYAGKLCAKCHTANAESARVCNLCGESLGADVRKAVSDTRETLGRTYKECPACQRHYPNAKIFCDECGGGLTMKSGIAANVNAHGDGAFAKFLRFVGVR